MLGGKAMLHFIKNHSLQIGERVECYYNSKKKLISVRSIDMVNDHNTKVVAYAEYLHLQKVTFSYCESNDRVVVKGIYCGGFPIMPVKEMMIMRKERSFFNTNNEKVLAADYAVLYKQMILAEKCILERDVINESIYKKRIF